MDFEPAMIVGARTHGTSMSDCAAWGQMVTQPAYLINEKIEFSITHKETNNIII